MTHIARFDKGAFNAPRPTIYSVNVTLRNGSLLMLSICAISVGDALIIVKQRCKANNWDAEVIEVL